MFISVSEYLRSKTAYKLIISRQLPDVGIDLDEDADSVCAQEVCNCIKNHPANLIKDCGIKTLGFDDLGPSAKYYPNHGYYKTPGDILVLNKRMLEDPIHGYAEDGRPISTFEFILAHELGHGWDAAQGRNSCGKDYSICNDWTSLSDWSDTPKPMHKRLRIREKGYPEKVGEWYYGPKAQFPRYYGKMNPWDDWADGFAYYVTGMKDKLPPEKLNYFNEKLSNYYTDPPIDLSLENYSPRYAFDTSKDPADHPEVPSVLKPYKDRYPELYKYIVLHVTPKKLTSSKVTFGVDIPSLKDYTKSYGKVDSYLKSKLGYIPEFDRSGKDDSKSIDDIKKIFEVFKNRGKIQGIKIGPPNDKVPVFEPGVPGGKMVKIASYLRGMAEKLDDKELRSVPKRMAADVKEVFRVNIGSEFISVKSFEQFFEESSEDDIIEALEEYKYYLDSVYESYKDKVKDSKSFKEVFKESAPNLIKMAIQAYKKPIPGRAFKDPVHPTQEEIVNFVRILIDKNLKNTFNRLKARI